MDRRYFLLTAAALALPAGTVFSQARPALRIGHPWMRPALSGRGTAGYLTISSTGPADALVRVICPAAAQVSLHESRVTDGIARMLPVTEIAVPAGGQATLAPGGFHIMFERLTREVREGQRIAATLVFRRAGRIPVTFAVHAAPPGQASGHSGHHAGH